MILSFNSAFMLRVSLFILHVLLQGTSCCAKRNHLCAASSCGDIRNISYPFRLKGDPDGCGLSQYELACEDNRTVLYLYDGRYHVKWIVYSSYQGEKEFSGQIRVVDDGLQKGDCSSLPRYSLAPSNFSKHDPYYKLSAYRVLMASVVFISCSQPVSSGWYVDTKPCIEGESSAGALLKFSEMKVYTYAVDGFDLPVSEIKDSCAITMTALFSDCCTRCGRDQRDFRSLLYEDLHDKMAKGFDLFYSANSKRRWRIWCYFLISKLRYERDECFYSSDIMWTMYLALVDACLRLPFVLAAFVATKFILGAPCVLILLTYKWMKRHQAMDANIEEFLRDHANFFPIRYSYSNIKKITKNFTHKLGEGGYGSVYKGMLRSGNEVAVKILHKSKSNGQDFINEVATIGRIHHVNVVQLVGFCFDNSKQALVYDFMPNGSLDKHISYKDGDDPLDYKKMYEISLGISRGIEYLHRGCDMQILHFDIKPHNILLDRNFTPKVSDFGLARLYPTGHNTVSLTAARGTLGYMAVGVGEYFEDPCFSHRACPRELRDIKV